MISLSLLPVPTLLRPQPRTFSVGPQICKGTMGSGILQAVLELGKNLRLGLRRGGFLVLDQVMKTRSIHK